VTSTLDNDNRPDEQVDEDAPPIARARHGRESSSPLRSKSEPEATDEAKAADGEPEIVFEPWTFRTVLRDYKLVPVLALLAGLLAFMGSMIVPPTYASGTRVLIRGRETTLLEANGQSLGGQPGVLDSQLAASLAETQGALLVTRSVAEQIVDRLDLDAPVESSGFISGLREFAAGAYLRTRATLTHGFYKRPERRERMIGQVQGGIGAKQVEGGYVIEIAGLWDDPDTAADITNAAADILVEQSSTRFNVESADYRDFLAAQVGVARQSESDAREAVSAYQREQGITSIDEELLLSTRSLPDLDSQVDAVTADLDDAVARRDALAAQLVDLAPTVDTNQEIRTGRSETVITDSEVNPTYATVNTQLQQVRAEVAGLEARLDAIVSARDRVLGADTAELTDEQAELRQLLFDQQIASEEVVNLTVQYNTAAVNAERETVELLRLDTAAPSTYPIGPKRYLYLGIGVFVGGLMAFVWSLLRVKRNERALLWEAEHGGGDADDLDDDDVDADESVEV
jgi:uncharacterized protein involved in exopolysaccharide biosynthesis